MLAMVWASLALAAAGVSCGRDSTAAVGASTPPPVGRPPIAERRAVGFTRLVPEETGLRFTNHISLAAVARNRLVEDGSGVAAGDVDGDGRCDLYFCNLEGANRLYRNLGGLRFEDVTRESGVVCAGQASTGVAFADIDGDGDLDLLVNGLGAGTRLFLNDGRGHFSEKVDSGFQRDSGARSLALADIDGDGDLDLYVANYRRMTSRDEQRRIRLSRRGGGFEVPAEVRDQFIAEANERGGPVLLELGEPDVLYRNLGEGRFEAISWTQGGFLDDRGQPLEQPPRDWGLSAMFRDLNGDGAPDLYVCNDFYSPDRLWLNLGDGRFQAAPATAWRKNSWASMAVDFADLNRDGLDEFFTAEMLGVRRIHRQTQRDNIEADGLLRLGWGWSPGEITGVTAVMRNALFLNLSGGHFAEIAQYSGVQASDWTWGAAFLDVDLDGFEDLLIANGHIRDHLNSDIQTHLAKAGLPKNAADRAALFGQIPQLAVPKRVFRNRGDLTFEDRSADWGFDWVGISTGMALADLDNDGDLDVVLNNLDAAALILRNESQAPRLSVRTRGQSPNTSGIGARVQVRAPGLPPQAQEMICGGRYLSADDTIRTFALGPGTNPVLVVEVSWRSGRHSTFNLTNGTGQTLLVLTEPVDSPPRMAPKPLVQGKPTSWFEAFAIKSADPQQGVRAGVAPGPEGAGPLFEDLSDRLALAHVHPSLEDPARQPLAPRKLTQNGPGLAWFDVHGDGHEAILFPAGHRRPMQIRSGDGSGAFSGAVPAPLPQRTDGESTSVLGWSTGPRTGLLVTGSIDADLGTNLLSRLTIQALVGSRLEAIQSLEVAGRIGPLAAADVDGDGDLDLFVGGQAEAGRYPVASRSWLIRQTDGRFGKSPEDTRLFDGVGLVNGAVWSDLDGDGWPELILACEWGPLRVFHNDHGRLMEWKAALSFPKGHAGAVRFTTLAELTGWWNGVAVGDFNGDGRLDIAAANWGRNTKYQEFIGAGLRLYHGDLNKDGIWEVIEAYWDAELKKEVPWRDFRTMSRAFPAILDRCQGYSSYAAASVQELFGPALDGARLLRAETLESVVLLNFGDRFEVRPLPMLAQLAPAFGPVVADFDGDGNEDLFLSQNFFGTDRETGRLDGGRGLLLRGDGTGGFTAMTPSESGLTLIGEQRGAAVADFDEDGRPDLAVAQHGAPLKLLRNRAGRGGRRIRLVGPPGNHGAIGAQLRLIVDGRHGPARELHAGTGYWSQDSAVSVLAPAGESARLWVRWPGGKVTETALPAGARESTVDSSGR